MKRHTSWHYPPLRIVSAISPGVSNRANDFYIKYNGITDSVKAENRWTSPVFGGSGVLIY